MGICKKSLIKKEFTLEIPVKMILTVLHISKSVLSNINIGEKTITRHQRLEFFVVGVFNTRFYYKNCAIQLKKKTNKMVRR